MAGENLERLVQYVYQSILDYSGQKIEVKRNVSIIGNYDQSNQFDVFYEFNLGGTNHRVAIECKDHKRPINVGNIRDFKKKLEDVGNCIGIMVSRNGFQKGTKRLAEGYGIELINEGETPLLFRSTATRIKILLPDENVIGQPFWALMEEKDGQITGVYITTEYNNDQILGLYISRAMAIKASEKTVGVVRGISQPHLRFLNDLSKHTKLKLAIALNDKNRQQFIMLTTEDVEHYFLLAKQDWRLY